MTISNICTNFIKNKQSSKAVGENNILEFCSAEWGLGLGTVQGTPDLYPAQKFILKCYYGLELDGGSNRNIIVNDQFNENELYRFNEKEYMGYLFDEGRININEIDRSYNNIILVAGRRGGKCVREGTYVLTEKGIQEIQDMGDPNGPEYQPLKVTVAQEGDRRSSSAFFYNGGKKNTIRIKSYCGFEEEGTYNHRVKVLSKDGTIQWRFLSDIKKGDILCIHRKTNMWAKDLVNVEKYKKGLVGRKDIVLPKVFDEKWATFLGVLVGDGTWNEKLSLSVTVGPYPEWIKQVQNMFLSTVGDYKELYSKNRAGRISFHSVVVREFFNRIGYKLGVSSDSKRVPWIILRSPKYVVAAFLRGFFETDGCTESGGRKVSFSTDSKKLAQEIQILLLNFGIISRIKERFNKKYNKTYYHIYLMGSESIRLFSKHIGFISERKKAPFLNHISKGDQGNKSRTEAIPYQREWCKKLRDSVPANYYNGMPGCKGRPGRNRLELKEAIGNVIKNTKENMSYCRLKKVIKVAEKVKANSKVIDHFKNFIETNYYFDKIIETKRSKAKVYDLNVPDGESFVANGIVNHNTTITSCIIAYETYKLLLRYSPQEYFGIMPEDDIRLTCISTSKETAGELFNKVTGHLDRSEFFRRYRLTGTKSSMYLQTQRDIEKYGRNNRATISIHVAPCSAKGVRGHGSIVVGLDEMAHFFEDEKTKGLITGSDKNDRSIYNAITPAVARFKGASDNVFCGKIICISSPGVKSGKFYEEYDRSFKKETKDLLMIQVPSWELAPDLSSEYLRGKFNENPIVFRCEHGAAFDDRLKGWIEDTEVVRQNIVPGLRYKDRSSERIPHFMGVDVGLKKDGTAIVVCHHIQEVIQGMRQTLIEVDVADVRYSSLENKSHFVPDEIADWIADFTKRFYVVKGLMDQWYGMAIVPLLESKGLKQFEYREFNENTNSMIFQNLLTHFISQTIRLPCEDRIKVGRKNDSDTELVSEVLSLQAYQKSKYIISVAAPEREGSHDDLSSALSRAVLLASDYKSKGYGRNFSQASSSQGKMFKVSKYKEMARMSLNRPTKGSMSARQMFSRAVYGSTMRQR